MDNLLDRPWFLRFTALALAIILFISVRGEEDNNSKNSIGDTVEFMRDIPVEVYYDNENLVVTGVPETVNMTIDGPANIVQSTKLMKDFTLKVDLRNLPTGQHTVEIRTENLSDKLHVKLDPATVDVNIEEKITKALPVDPEFNERLLADGFNVVKMEVEPSTIEVTGAKSVIDSIGFVKASASKDNGIDKSFEQRVRVRVLDRDLNKLNVTIVPEEVNLKVQVEENNKEVPIVLKQRGIPAQDVTIDSITGDLKSVRLFGPRAVLDSIKELGVQVDITGIHDSGTIEVNLPKPKGVTSLSDDKVKVKIEITKKEEDIETPPDVSMNPEQEGDEDKDKDKEQDKAPVVKVEVTKSFPNIPIEIKGLNQTFKSTFSKPADGLVNLTVTADKEVIDSLKASDLHVSVDLSKVESEGKETFPVHVDVPEHVAWKLSDEEVVLDIVLA